MNKPFSPEKKADVQTHILSAAKTLFLAEGIAPVKMTDIAIEAHLGVATLYRYFRVKKAIVIAVATSLWSEKEREFAEISKQNDAEHLSGIASLTILLNHFYDLLTQEKALILFVRNFDSFCLSENVKPSELTAYDAIFSCIESLFLHCGEKGIRDGTIRSDRDFALTYSAFSRAIIGLAEKLSNDKAIVPSDQEKDPRMMIRSLIDVLLAYFAQ
jgi:AcrR family transcriptional regulator